MKIEGFLSLTQSQQDEDLFPSNMTALIASLVSGVHLHLSLLDKISDRVLSQKNLAKNEVFVRFHSNLEILIGFQKPRDPAWIRHCLFTFK